MAFKVRFTRRAQRDLNRLGIWISDDAPWYGPPWFAGLLDAIALVREFPNAWPEVANQRHRGLPVRRLVYPPADGTHIVYFCVEETAVRVIHIRNGARKAPRVM